MEENKPSFEQSMKRLEQIVQLLEKGDAPLEDAMKLFSEGTALAASCQFMLEQAEQKLKIGLICSPECTFVGAKDTI